MSQRSRVTTEEVTKVNVGVLRLFLSYLLLFWAIKEIPLKSFFFHPKKTIQTQSAYSSE